MMKTLLCASALLVAAPAVAQRSAEPTPGGNATQPTPTEQVVSIVDSEFPAYDENQSGKLEQTEFTKWMAALKTQEMKATGKTIPPAEVTAWASGAFVAADADKNGVVTKEELVKYLTGAA